MLALSPSQPPPTLARGPFPHAPTLAIVDAWTNKRKPPTQTWRQNSTPSLPPSQRAERSGVASPTTRTPQVRLLRQHPHPGAGGSLCGSPGAPRIRTGSRPRPRQAPHPAQGPGHPADAHLPHLQPPLQGDGNPAAVPVRLVNGDSFLKFINSNPPPFPRPLVGGRALLWLRLQRFFRLEIRCRQPTATCSLTCWNGTARRCCQLPGT